MQFQTHRQVDGSPQPAGLVYVRIGSRQPENIRGKLHCGLALTTAAADPDLGDGNMRVTAGALGTLAQPVSEPFQDGAVEMGAGMHITKTDDGALGFGAGDLQTRRPVRLQGQPERARGNRIDEIIEQFLCRNAALPGQALLVHAELAFEPGDHPESTVDLDLQRVPAGDGGRVRRDEGDHLDIFFERGVNGGGCAVREAGDVRFDTTGTDHFAGFIGCRGDER